MATQQIDQEKLEAFVERIVLDVGTAMRGGLVYIGDRLGIYKAMADAGPVTVEQLAERTGLNERYLREWLGSMTTAEYVEHDSEDDTYLLPAEHALPLADEEFPHFTGGFLQMIVPTVTVAPKVAEAFKNGGGVTQDEYLPDMYEAIERGTAPWYKHNLVPTWIPALPDAQRKLEDGGTVASPKGQFDLVTTFDVVHDSVDPVGLITAIRESLTDGGTFLMLEMNASGDVDENANPLGKLLYNVSTLYCMTTSLAHDGAGIGACMGQHKAEELAEQAGYGQFRKLPIEDPFSVLYELKA